MEDDRRIILEGRIYPSIQNSVKNRYFLLLGFFAVYGYYYFNSGFREAIYTYPFLKWGLFVFWSLLSLHNYFNYLLVANEQRKKEQPGEHDNSRKWWARIAIMELSFMFLFITLNLAWIFLPTDVAKSVIPENIQNPDIMRTPIFMYNYEISRETNIWDKVIRMLFTPIIALAAVCIAGLQYLINKNNLHYQKYGPRVHIYKKVMNFIRVASDRVDWPDLINFNESIAGSEFIFPREINLYLKEISDRVNNLIRWQHECRDYQPPLPVPQGYEHDKVVGEITKEREWIINQVGIAKEKFRKYLSII